MWRRLTGVLGLAGLVFAALAWFVAGQLVAPAQRVVRLPSDLPLVSERIDIGSGAELAVSIAAFDDSSSVVVLLHPLRGNRRSMLSRAELFYEAGHSVVLIDMQAHGESTGDAITFGHREQHDAIAAVTFAKRRFPGSRVCVVGQSLGAAAAILAGPLGIDALVVEAVYPTLDEAVSNRVGQRLGMLKYIVKPALICQLYPRLGIRASDLRPIDCIADVGCRILILAGGQDAHTPLAESKRIWAAARQPKRLIVFPDAAHEDLLKKDSRLYSAEVLAFLEGA